MSDVSLQPPKPVFLIGMAFLIAFAPMLAALAPRGLFLLPSLVGLLGWGGLFSLKQQAPQIQKTLLFGLISVSILMVISPLWGFDPDVITLARPMRILPLLLGTYLCFTACYAHRLHLAPMVSRWLPVGVLIAGLIILTDLLANSIIYDIVHGPGQRSPFPTIMSHLNRGILSYGFFALIAFAFLIRDIKTLPKEPLRFCSLIALIILSAAIFFKTESQSTQIIFLLAPLIALLVPCWWQKGWVPISLIFSAILIGAPFIAQAMYDFLPPISETIEWLKHGYAPQRMEIWDFIARRALEHPWLGHGIDATRHITDFDVPHIYQKENTILHPHNFLLQIWIEFGLLGAVLYSAIFTLAVRKLWQRLNTTQIRISTTIVFAFIIVAAMSYGMWQSWWIGLAGLVFAISTIILPSTYDNKSPT